MIPNFDTLDDAVRSSFPPESCSVVAVREHGDDAVALFDTRPTGEPYLYEVHYRRENGRWAEGSSSNGSGWQNMSRDSSLGVVTAWGEAAPHADTARAEFDGRVYEEAVVGGVYFFVWWDVPLSHPRVIDVRVRGQWVRAPSTWQEFEAQRQALLRARGS